MQMLEFGKYESSIFGTDGSGNQKKLWLNNCLYKIDSKFRDSTKEYSASNIADAIELNHVKYFIGEGLYENNKVKYCYSYNYLRDGEENISLYNLLDLYDFNPTFKMSATEYFNTTCNIISDFIKLDLTYIKLRLLQILAFDFLICNDDRHLRNIDIIRRYDGSGDIAPIFDNGHSFFRRDSVLTKSQIEMLSYKHKSKPFSTNQWKNLIDINFAKSQVLQWRNIIESKYGSITNLPNVLESHNKIFRYRINQLLTK